jgi:tetratricopeptide (TPR) repeat protein
VAKAGPRGEELRRTILPIMVELSRESSKNRSKHVCRRLVAEAYVEAGDLTAARENIDQLLNLTPKLPFHQVTPLTQIAWRELAAGNKDAATAAMEQALKLAPELPQVSRLTFDATTDLAALLFVLGRAANAQSLMTSDSVLPTGSNGTLSALSRRVHLLQSFDFDEAAASLPVIPWKSPQWVVTTLTLVLRGHAEKGVEWLKRAPDAATKADCWAVWGDAVVAANASGAAKQDEPITAAIKGEAPTTQARVWARVAAARLTAKEPAAAKRAAEQANTALQAVPLPSNFVLLEMKEFIKQPLPDATAPRLNAIAAAEVARTQTLLGQTESAAKTLTAALQHLRGHAPTALAAGKLFEATSRDVNSVRAQLRKDLNLKTDDKVQQALTNYRDKCRSAFDAGTARFKLQTEILMTAVDWPLVDAVWMEATAHATEGTPDEEREDFLKTALSVRLGQRLRAAGELDQARQCENAVTTGEFTDLRDSLQRETAEIAAKGENIARIAQKLGAIQASATEGSKTASDDTEWPLLWALRLACRVAKSGKTDTAFDLISGFTTDMLAREEGYEMLAAMTAKDPAAGEQIWKKYRPSLMSPTEKIAVFRGLCAGLTASLSTHR